MVGIKAIIVNKLWKEKQDKIKYNPFITKKNRTKKLKYYNKQIVIK